jgi:hypothetical protein
MLVCMNASEEALCPFIVATNSVTLGIFQGGVHKRVDVKIPRTKRERTPMWAMSKQDCDDPSVVFKKQNLQFHRLFWRR